MIRPIIGIDWDDTFAPFNSIAIKMANQKYLPNVPFRLEEVTSWENEGRTSVIKEFYNDISLYNAQTAAVTIDRIQVIKRLMEIADVYFITAVYPKFMGVRAEQIMQIFPELPHDRILLGAAKKLVQFDILLDDNIRNVLESPSKYPVLMRKPWNQKMTGLLSVNNLDEFYELVQHIISAGKVPVSQIKKVPHVVALIGPACSKKTELAHELVKDANYVQPKTYTTKPERCGQTKYHVVSEEDFFKHATLEHTMYAGYRYGTSYDDIAMLLADGKNVVMPLDMCGAISINRYFPTLFVYTKRGKECLVRDIVIADDMSDEEKALCLLSLNAERKNEHLCHLTVRTDDMVSSVRDII